MPTDTQDLSHELMLVEFDEDTDWMSDALCAQTDPEIFFPDKGGSIRAAKAVCASCAARQDCLNYALEHREPSGIWGGLSPRERRGLLRAGHYVDEPTTTHSQNGTAA